MQTHIAAQIMKGQSLPEIRSLDIVLYCIVLVYTKSQRKSGSMEKTHNIRTKEK
jgi:hypothetical protein